ncbi:MAG TPA: glycine betaine ABC transporter substrate-binding protein [Opitutaceae bacterium]
MTESRPRPACRWRRALACAAVVSIGLQTAISAVAEPAAPPPIVVASKPFAESFLLGEMFAQLLEARGFSVERRLGLGATEIAFRALREGAVDVYPEYTGTGLVAILHEPPRADSRAVFRRVATVFAERWQVRWLPPLGFQNTYAIAVRPEVAQRHHLRTLSDLARAAGQLTAGFTPDFIGRDDGLKGLERAYGLRPGAVRSLVQAVKYRALAAGEVDVVDGYSTDGAIARHGFVVLEDDRGFFPAYEAAALISARLAQNAPAIAALTELSGRLDEVTLRTLNERLEVDGEDIARVAREALQSLRLTAVRDGSAGPASATGPDEDSLWTYFRTRAATIARLLLRHVFLVGISLLAAIAVALPLGLALERFRRGAEATVRAAGLLQTIPGIALLAFMIPLLGIGVVPAVVALFAYSLYPIVRNTYTGVRDAGVDAVAAGHAMGMTPRQLLLQVRLPLAAPVIMAGIRTAAVINVGTATLAAFIGAGGLGDPIVAGLALNDPRLILTGAIPAALLALAVDVLLGGAERLLRPRI